MIVFTILFGTTKFSLSYSEYVTLLSVMGFMTGVTLFCWIVIFTFRKNLLMESEYSRRPEMGSVGPKSVVDQSGHPTAPPPAYSANPAGYGGWVPPTHVFPDQPPANTVSMTDAPPPYPGINGDSMGYNSGGAGGWTAPGNNLTSAQRKEAEAAASAPVQTGYFDPNNSGVAYVPPPAYNDLPPAYDEDKNKKNK